MTNNRGEVVAYAAEDGRVIQASVKDRQAMAYRSATADFEIPLVPQSLLLAAREECERLQLTIDSLDMQCNWRRLEAQLTQAVSDKERVDAELARLRSAIQQHKDKFPDEPLDGELTLWAAIDACVGGE